MLPRIGIVIGSTRPGRVAREVASWVYDHASKRSDAAFEVIDLADFELPLLDEPLPSCSVLFTTTPAPGPQQWRDATASCS